MSMRFTRGQFLRIAGAAALAPLIDASASTAAQSQQDRNERLKLSCRGALTLRHPDAAEEAIRVGTWAQRQGLFGDRYGVADFIGAFEQRIADLLGFAAACVMPTGTMAQLIALRIFADRSQYRTVGLHPSSHLLIENHDDLSVMHQLQARIIGPWDRPLLADDIARWPERLGAISVELPVRWIGCQLQSWEQLGEIKRICSNRGIRLHMDGARLWESQPFYARPHAEICKGFDSVYVSLYKLIGAPGGAVLAGSQALIAEARIWRRRHGGDVFQFFPYVASASMRLDNAMAKVDGYRQRALVISTALATLPQLTVLPAPSQTNIFRVFLRGDSPTLLDRRNEIARRHGIWLANTFASAHTPGFVQAELQIAESAVQLADAEIIDAFKVLLA